MTKKTFVIDTNVFLHDPRAIYAFDDNNVVIPMIVLEEIDKKKERMDEVGSNARRTCRILDELRGKGSLSKGVEIQKGGTLRILSAEDFQGVLPDELNDRHPDNMIVAVAVGLRDKLDEEVKVVTKDINMRIKCNVLGVVCDDYKKYKVATDLGELYTGITTHQFTQDEIIALSENRSIEYEVPSDWMPNQFIIDDKHNMYARVDPDTQNLLVVNEETSYAYIKPRNVEQAFAMKLLYDDRIKLVTLVGQAGCGKTLLAIAAAFDLTIEQGKYNKIVITRPIQPVGRDLGYLPGTKQEKMEPWVQPINDNIEFLLGNRGKGGLKDDMLQMWQSKGIIETEAITYIRGRSISNAYIIIDEAQNLTAHELKTIITRAGQNSKIVLTGDIQQIDNSFVDPFSNGMTYSIEKFKNQSIAGHVTLTQGERSELASIAAKIL